MKYMRRKKQDTLGQIKKQMHKLHGFKNNTNFEKITGIQEKLNATCK